MRGLRSGMPITYKQDKGFTLIEMSVVIMITSVLLAMAVSFALPIIQGSRDIETQQKLARIKEAIAEYAVTNNRIPCPATPVEGANYGIEAGNGTALGTSGFRCNSNFGMVPFQTLGLSGSFALDGWGNPITYAVSPAFVLSTVEAQTSVHMLCRTRDWFYSNGRPVASGTIDAAPINAEKAAFCCAGNVVGSNLSVTDENGNNVLALTRASMVAGDLAAATTIYATNINTPSTYPSSTSTPSGIAFVLVSHGANERGAYETVGGTRINAPTAACETENTNNDVNFRDCPFNDNTGSATFNDDITVWATQDELFTSQGQSCAVP